MTYRDFLDYYDKDFKLLYLYYDSIFNNFISLIKFKDIIYNNCSMGKDPFRSIHTYTLDCVNNKDYFKLMSTRHFFCDKGKKDYLIVTSKLEELQKRMKAFRSYLHE